MVNHAITSELMTLQLEIPYSVPEHAGIDPWKVSDLLYDLAITFGAISLANEDVVLFGEWGGKSSSDYLRENVRVRFRSQEAYPELEQQLSICRKIASS
jgi:hypothetical protein